MSKYKQIESRQKDYDEHISNQKKMQILLANMLCYYSVI